MALVYIVLVAAFIPRSSGFLKGCRHQLNLLSPEVRLCPVPVIRRELWRASNGGCHRFRASESDEEEGPVWKGGTYSWKPERRPARPDAPVRVISLQHGGEVQIRQKADRLEDDKRTGVALWSAALSLSDYVDARCASSWWGGNTTCLELGAGLGLPSVVAARHGLSVIATEKDPEVLPLLEQNLKSNLRVDDDSDDSKAECRVQVHALDWQEVSNDPDAEKYHPALLALKESGGPDLILLSDVVYGATEPVWGALLSLLNRLRNQRKPGKSKMVLADGSKTFDPLVLLGYTCRRRDMTPDEEGRFFAMVRNAGMEASPIPHGLVPNSDKRPLTTVFELRWTR